MQLVEVIVAEKTSDETRLHALDLVQAPARPPSWSDRRGFYTSRVFGTYLTEGIAMLQTAWRQRSSRTRVGWRACMPPLGLADEVGLALMYQVGVQTKKDLGDAAPVNPSDPVLELLVARAGRKDNAGAASTTTTTADGDSGPVWTHFPRADVQPSPDEVIERYLYVQAVEAARCMDEGVVQAIPDADGRHSRLGLAPHTGGPLSFIDGVGVAAFVSGRRAGRCPWRAVSSARAAADHGSGGPCLLCAAGRGGLRAAA